MKRFGPRASTSPSGPIRTSTPGIASPTVPSLLRAARVKLITGAGHLGRAVALQDVEAHLRPPRRELGIHRRSTDGNGAQAPAELGEHRSEEEPFPEGRQAPSPSVQALEDLAPPGLLDLALDRLVEQLQALRDDEEHGRPEVA